MYQNRGASAPLFFCACKTACGFDEKQAEASQESMLIWNQAPPIFLFCKNKSYMNHLGILTKKSALFRFYFLNSRVIMQPLQFAT
jgi:hypothetical protein